MPESIYEIGARVGEHGGWGNDDIVACFDPSVVISRLRRGFPEAEILMEDLAQKDIEGLRAARAGEKALAIAKRDAWRRGPRFRFRFPDHVGIKGVAERYWVHIWSDEPIPEPLKSQFLAFLESLRFAPYVVVTSVRIEGNNETDA